MKKGLLLSLSAVALSASAFAQHQAHEHGVAHMNVMIESKSVEIELETPLANLISFEHAPETQAQKEEVQAMVAKLHNADQLFVFPREAQCQLEESDFHSAVIDDELLGKPHDQHAHENNGHAHEHDHDEAAHEHNHGHNHEHSHSHDHNHAQHGDLEAHLHFTCQNPIQPQQIQVKLFETFPALHEIKVQMVTPHGQSARELSAQSPNIEW